MKKSKFFQPQIVLPTLQKIIHVTFEFQLCESELQAQLIPTDYPKPKPLLINYVQISNQSTKYWIWICSHVPHCLF